MSFPWEDGKRQIAMDEWEKQERIDHIEFLKLWRVPQPTMEACVHGSDRQIVKLNRSRERLLGQIQQVSPKTSPAANVPHFNIFTRPKILRIQSKSTTETGTAIGCKHPHDGKSTHRGTSLAQEEMVFQA